MAGEKTEKATPKKRRDQRKEGNVVQSKDIVTVCSLLAVFWFAQIYFPTFYTTLKDGMVQFISYIDTAAELSVGDLRELGMECMYVVAKAVLPLLVIAAAVEIAATGAQTRFLFAAKVIRPDFGRLSPLRGVKNLFSLRNLVEFVKGLIKITLLGAILYMLLKDELFRMANTMDMDLKVASVYVLQTVLSMVFKVCLFFAFVAGLDYMYQRWEYERKIRMSKEELKEEYKQLEGNPEIKGRIRNLQRQRAQTRMMQAVPEADVIIRNPTHYAVALKYDSKRDRAPRLVAKGQDELALRIVKVAEENEVIVIENKPLARGIYASTPLDAEIPGEYYGVVAEILVQVYRMKNKTLV